MPDQGADAPAAVTSLKSTSDSVATAAAVTVRVIPIPLLRTAIRDVAVVDVPSVNVPRIVGLPLRITEYTRAVVGLDIVRLLKVFVPTIVLVEPVAPVNVKDTL